MKASWVRTRALPAAIAVGVIAIAACSTRAATTTPSQEDGAAPPSDQDAAPSCPFPAGATPEDDASLYGCQGIFPAPSCAAGQFEVYCVGPFDGGADASVPQPAASLGCVVSPQATIPNALYGCCPCGP
jgi:hypothetical protein